MKSPGEGLHSLKEISIYFNKLWGKKKPICKLFHTESASYLYDTGTNKILECEELEYSLLEELMVLNIEDAFIKWKDQYSEELLIQTAKKVIVQPLVLSDYIGIDYWQVSILIRFRVPG